MTGFPSGCLGKLPLHGDFIRYNAGSPEVHELDHWIGEGIVHGYHELGGSWDRTFDAAPRASFVYISPKSRRVVAGILRPYVDKAGRRYPFLVYALLENTVPATDLPYLPWALEHFIAKAAEVAHWADTSINLNMFLSHFDALRFEPDMGESRRNFGKYVLMKPAAEFLAQDFGAADDPRAFAALQSVSEGPELKGHNALAVRLPLGEGMPGAAFWLELARRMTKTGTLPVLTYWSEATADLPARLHLCFGELGSRHFLPLVLPSRPDPVLRDLAGVHGDPEAARKGKATFDQVLSAGSLKLSDLLQRLPRCKGL